MIQGLWYIKKMSGTAIKLSGIFFYRNESRTNRFSFPCSMAENRWCSVAGMIGQAYQKGGAAAWCIPDGYFPVMQTEDFSGDAQAQTKVFPVLMGGISPVESLENRFFLGVRNTGAIICDGDLQEVPVAVKGQANASAGGCIA